MVAKHKKSFCVFSDKRRHGDLDRVFCYLLTTQAMSVSLPNFVPSHGSTTKYGLSYCGFSFGI